MAKKLKSIDIGTLTIEDMELECAVLEDGVRVITTNSILKAFGRTQRGWYKNRESKLLEHLRTVHPNNDLQQLPIFMDSKALLSVTDDKILELLTPITYVDNGSDKEGFSALILPKICDLYLKARREDILNHQQKHLAAKSEILLSALSQVGIIALVDEATGYQYKRESDELQRILKQYISEELLPWQKKFPDIFYKELFRLNKWDFTVNGIKKRPGVVGKWTNTLIYDQLPKGVLSELRKNIPKSPKGNKTVRLHQFLTEDIGNPHLKSQINQIVTLFQLSDDMKHMWQQFEKLKIRQSGQLELPFNFDEKGHTIEPIEESTLSDFNKKLKKGLEYNPKD